MSAAFLSRVEQGKEKPPAEKKLKALSRVLGCKSDLLFGLAGRIPADVMRVIQRHPCEYFALTRCMRKLTAEEVKVVQKKIEKWCEERSAAV